MEVFPDCFPAGTRLGTAEKMLAVDGKIVTLIKPHYEAEPQQLRGGVLRADLVDLIVQHALAALAQTKLRLIAQTTSPIKGAKGNIEVLALLQWATPASSRRSRVASPLDSAPPWTT